MTLTLTPAAATAGDEARRFVTERILPHAAAWEAQGDFPRALFLQAGQAGLLGWKVPPELGGRGPDFLADAAVTEELAACGSGGVAAGLGAHKDLGPYYIARFGTDEQRRRWVPAAVAGEIVGALAVTEPHAGSDVAGIRTRARPQPGGDWVLDGTKTFITNGTRADVIVVAALTDPDADGGGHHGTTLFVLESTDPGFSARRIPTLGWRTSSTGELTFADVHLPADRVLGGQEAVGQGFVSIMRNFQWERIVMALAAARGARDGLGRAVGGQRQRGRMPNDRLADLAGEVEAASALARDALRRFVDGQDAVRETSMAKWFACDLAVRVAEEALRLAGPAGLTGDEARALRDARLGPIGGGTTEIMLEVIGRGYGL